MNESNCTCVKFEAWATLCPLRGYADQSLGATTKIAAFFKGVQPLLFGDKIGELLLLQTLAVGAQHMLLPDKEAKKTVKRQEVAYEKRKHRCVDSWRRATVASPDQPELRDPRDR